MRRPGTIWLHMLVIGGLLLAGTGVSPAAEEGKDEKGNEPAQREKPQADPPKEQQNNNRQQQGDQQNQNNNNNAGNTANNNQTPPPQNNNANNRGRGERGTSPPRQATPKRTPSGPALGEFAASIDTETSMLRLHPAGKSDRQDYQVTVGQEFTTEVSFDNQNLTPFEEVRVLLSYDTEIVEPVSINDSVLAPHLKDEPIAEVDPLFGMILYQGSLKEPLVLNDIPLLSVKWKAKQITLETRIEFSSREDIYTALVGGDVDLLGNPRTPGDGTLNMTVTIVPEDPREAEAMLNAPRIFEGDDGKIGGVKLLLKPQPEPIMVGEPFYVDLVLDNRAFSNLDGVSVLLSFDPQIIRILDADQDNFITLETNILDGPFHETFPWNYHVDNVVYNTRGFISYRVGTSDSDMARGKLGTIARIYAVAERPTQGTPLVFRFAKKARDKGTEVSYNGKDCLGDPKKFADGAKGVALRVLPKMHGELAVRMNELTEEPEEEVN